MDGSWYEPRVLLLVAAHHAGLGSMSAALYQDAAENLRGELLDLDLPRHFKDLLQRMLQMCEAGLSFPSDYRDQYVNFLTYKQKVNRYGH